LALGATADAADLRRPYVAGPAMMAPAYNWTGFYFGGHVGGGWLDHYSYEIALPGNFVNQSPGSFLGGAQVGFNWQSGPWVLGVEGQFSWTDMNATTASILFPGFSKNTHVDWLGTVAGRIGYAWNNWMIYAKGGWAFANIDYRILFNAGSYAALNDTLSGWMVGAGLEYGFWNNWSMKLEYNYMDFGDKTLTFVPAAPNPTEIWRTEDRIHVVKLGVNYRFGGKAPVPVVTKY
jgi:outer membrane immunogenic protein